MFEIHTAEECAPRSEEKLTITTIELEHVIIVRTCGRLQFRAEAALFRARMEEVLTRSKSLILDFADLESIDSAGLGELVFVHLRARAQLCEVSIVSCPKRVRELLELANIASLFRISNRRPQVQSGLARRRL